MSKKSLIFSLWSLGAAVATTAAIVVPAVLATVKNKNNNENQLPGNGDGSIGGPGNDSNTSIDLANLDGDIWTAINNRVNSTWTDIGQKSTIQEQLVTDINNIVNPYGINVTRVDITLVDGTDSNFKVANPVTIIFDQQISGSSYSHFSANGNKLATNEPIQTGISNLAQTDGTFDLSSIEDEIYSKITAVVNQDWTDITLESTNEQTLIDSINSVVSAYGINVTNVDITLVDGTNSNFKVANPVTITFDQQVSGTYSHFSANGNTLATNSPIQTGISNLAQTDGSYDLSSLEGQIWQILLDNINPWNDISIQDQVQNTIKQQINKVVNPYNVEVNNVSLNLTPGKDGAYYTVAPATIEFNHQILGEYSYFGVNNSSLVSKQPINTAISTYYSTDGYLSIPDEVLTSIEDLVGMTASREWNKNSTLNNRLLNDPKSQFGEDIYNQLIKQLNNLLPENYPCQITALNNVVGLEKSFNVNPTESGKLASKFIGFELVDKNTNKQINKFNINSTEHMGINNKYPTDQPKDQLVYNNLTTAYDCFWFNDDQVQQIIDLVQNWVYNNWPTDLNISDFESSPGDHWVDLYNQLNQLVQTFGILPNYTPSIMTASEIGRGICGLTWANDELNQKLINNSQYGNDVEWVRFFFPTTANINGQKINLIPGGNNIRRFNNSNNQFVTYGYVTEYPDLGYGLWIYAPTKVPLTSQNK